MQAISAYGLPVDLDSATEVRMWNENGRYGVTVDGPPPSIRRIVLQYDRDHAEKLYNCICDLRGFVKATGKPPAKMTREAAADLLRMWQANMKPIRACPSLCEAIDVILG